MLFVLWFMSVLAALTVGASLHEKYGANWDCGGCGKRVARGNLHKIDYDHMAVCNECWATMRDLYFKDKVIPGTNTLVSVIVQYFNFGASDEVVLMGFPKLNKQDLTFVRNYYRKYQKEIDDEIKENEK
jgi:uncharacterized protein (DUF433 family)